jgi:hypothetical protein
VRHGAINGELAVLYREVMDLENLDHDEERKARLKFDTASTVHLVYPRPRPVLFYASSENQESLSGRDRQVKGSLTSVVEGW